MNERLDLLVSPGKNKFNPVRQTLLGAKWTFKVRVAPLDWCHYARTLQEPYGDKDSGGTERNGEENLHMAQQMIVHGPRKETDNRKKEKLSSYQASIVFD